MVLRHTTISTAVLGVVLAFAGCQKNAVDDAPPTENETAAAAQPAAAPAEPAGTGTVIYHRDLDHGPRVYLPLDSAPCAADESANVTYQPKTLWKFDASAGQWTQIDFGTATHWRVGCNAMVALADIVGHDFEPGTYAVAAEVDGRLETGVVYEGPVMCNDVALGEPPAGQVSLCILGPDSAEARHVPDPATLAL